MLPSCGHVLVFAFEGEVPADSVARILRATEGGPPCPSWAEKKEIGECCVSMTRMRAGLMNGVYPSAFANRTPSDDLHFATRRRGRHTQSADGIRRRQRGTALNRRRLCARLLQCSVVIELTRRWCVTLARTLHGLSRDEIRGARRHGETMTLRDGIA